MINRTQYTPLNTSFKGAKEVKAIVGRAKSYTKQTTGTRGSITNHINANRKKYSQEDIKNAQKELKGTWQATVLNIFIKK